MFDTALQQGSGWQAAHEALTRLARPRAGLDFEEGVKLRAGEGARVHERLGYGSFVEYMSGCLATHAAHVGEDASAWATVTRSEGESAFVPIDRTSTHVADRGRQTDSGVGAGRGSAHVGISAKSTSSRAREAYLAR
jgi:hypothetical protein